MAYVLGFFAADGYMIRNKRGGHFVDFYNNELEVLEKIQKAIGSGHKISKRLERGNQQASYRIQIGNKIWFQDLTTLGFIQGKSKVLKMPVVPKKYLSHFTRGYFDGDGNIWTGLIHKNDRPRPLQVLSLMFTCGSEKFIEELRRQLGVIAKLKGGSLAYQSRAYRLSYSTHDALQLYRFMYKNAKDLFLSRKKVRFEEFLKLRA